MGAQEPETLVKLKSFSLSLREEFLTTDMTSKKIPRLLAGCFHRSQRSGGNSYTTKREQQLYVVSLVFSTTVWAPGSSRIAGTPFASAAWKVSGVMPNFSVRWAHVIA
jgi:hypothetical protein